MRHNSGLFTKYAVLIGYLLKREKKDDNRHRTTHFFSRSVQLRYMPLLRLELLCHIYFYFLHIFSPLFMPWLPPFVFLHRF